MIFVISLIVVVVLFLGYAKTHRPPPSVLTGFMVAGALFWASFYMVSDGTLWGRLLMAGLWILLAVGVVIGHLSLRKQAARRWEAIYLDASYLPLDDVIRRFQSLGFTVKTDVLYEGQSFAFVAHKVSIGVLSAVKIFFMMAWFGRLDVAGLRDYGSICLRYAEANTFGPRILRSLECCPVALVSGVERALAENVRAREPTREFTGTQMPIIWDLSNGQLHYSRATTWQLDMRDLRWDALRHTIVRVFGGTS